MKRRAPLTEWLPSLPSPRSSTLAVRPQTATRRKTMSAEQSLMARRHFLITSALVGTAGLVIPSVAHAGSAPPPPADAQTTAVGSTSSASAGAIAGASLLGTAAAAE